MSAVLPQGGHNTASTPHGLATRTTNQEYEAYTTEGEDRTKLYVKLFGTARWRSISDFYLFNSTNMTVF